MRKHILFILSFFLLGAGCWAQQGRIDRMGLVARNCPAVESLDTLASFSVGNGGFALTVDATGLQTFPEYYANGVPLGTQSHWGWHSFPNSNEYKFEETLEAFDFGHGHPGLYSVQPGPVKGGTAAAEAYRRKLGAANYFRANPHRLHLGTVGLELLHAGGSHAVPGDISGVKQQLDLWKGRINSAFIFNQEEAVASVVCHPSQDLVAGKVKSALVGKKQVAVKLRFPFPTGEHSDDACNWSQLSGHETKIVEQGPNFALIKRNIDTTTYFMRITWEGKAVIREKTAHYFVLEPQGDSLLFTAAFAAGNSFGTAETFDAVAAKAAAHWEQFWTDGAAVDFSQCTGEGAKELERRVVLSQYLTAIQGAAPEPPQETGLTYNSWFGKFHLEMHWWHQAHFALWNRTHLLAPSMEWYKSVEPVARDIAQRQHFDGIRWMKMTDPSGMEAPSSVGSFLVWQQPHYIYMAELIYRQRPGKETLDKYLRLVMETATFMASFATEDTANNRYVLKGLIPAQETLRPEEVINPPFELSYWRFALATAQQWRERAGMERMAAWDRIINRLSPLAEKNGLYLAAESAPQTYEERRFTSDHMIVLGSVGILPQPPLLEPATMRRTFDWVWDNWDWDHTWGWDFPTIAMCAARLGEPQKAVRALLMDKQTNTYLPNGHNYQNGRLRIYLPGNGGLLTAIAMMCAGWDGAAEPSPGFPKDGKWNVRWEGLSPLP